MALYKHGVATEEQPTSVATPAASASGLQVIIGTAPVNMTADPAAGVNTPKLCYSFAEAQAAVGYNTDFADYTLCESIYTSFQVASAAPIVLINVLDPAKHKKTVTKESVTLDSHIGYLAELGAIKSTIVVSNVDAKLTEGKDYTLSYDSTGRTMVSMISTGSAYALDAVTATYDALDPSKVTDADIIGGLDASTGKETGIELVRQVYPRFGMAPGFLLAPHWSRKASVAAALNAKTTKLNGNFHSQAVIDIDVAKTKSYVDVAAAKEAQGVSSSKEITLWPNAKIGDYIIDYSALYAAIQAAQDQANDDVPARKVSSLAASVSAAVLDDGTEVNLDETQAAVLNGAGIVTLINASGWRIWGNNTAAYPGSSDPKERWITCRRMFNFLQNTFIESYHSHIDDPTDPRLREAIITSFNGYLNSLASAGKIYGGEISYDAADNPESELLNGHVVFHISVAPLIPAEYIKGVFEFDASIMTAAMNGGAQ